MTLLVLAHKRILMSNVIRTPYAIEWLMEKSRGGRVTLWLLGGIIFCVFIYLLALFTTFSLSFQIRENTRRYDELSEHTLRSEILLQQRKSELAENHTLLLQSMERVSSVKYLTPESVASLK